MKRTVIFAVVAVSLLTIGLIAAIASDYGLFNGLPPQKPFYVGVTYCGNSTEDAKVLVDRVKNYTNLFVLQSGSLMTNETAVAEIGDYAVSCGLHFAVYFESGANMPPQAATWLDIAEQRWSDMFAGVYFRDELGGKMLDTYMDLSENGTSGAVVKLGFGGLQVGNTTYFLNGTVTVFGTTGSFPDPSFFMHTIGDTTPNYTGPDVFESNLTAITISYYPNFSITIGETFTSTTYYHNGSWTTHERHDDLFTTENGSDRVAQVEPYEEVLSRNPIPNCDVAAETFTNRTRKLIDDLSNQWQLSSRSFPIFTADYALCWWDYQSGYDMVLAELGWNNTVAQEIGLVRGAANLQNKPWGTIITWKYTQPPYLTNGNEMYEQMRMSYESGADYVIVFNYAQDMQGPYGTLKDEHFEALERFWNDVVRNPAVAHGGIKAEAAFVLPKNYGWGLRRPTDSVWGLWEPNAEAQKAWPLLQDAVAKHGLRLDIVYDDPAYSFAGKYPQVYYWNQTS